MSNKKTMSQVEYLMDQLHQEKEAIIKEEAEEKVEEFSKILWDCPAKDFEKLVRILNMMSKDLKNIYQQV